MTPVFIKAIDDFVSGADRSAKDSLFFIFHLLGEWREKSAYRPLARLLRCPRHEIELGGAVTETIHRVMAAVFDGDPEPLYEVILDPSAEQFIRAGMLTTLTMVTVSGELSRDTAARFLQACYSDLLPQDECYVWEGWQGAIAMLGLAEFKPLVERAFARGFVSPTWLGFHDFEQDLQEAIDHPSTPFRTYGGDYTLFGDTIKELSWWYCFRPKSERDREVLRGRTQLPSALAASAVNRYKDVGRNDPCPCGSGKKFKKCCLTAAA